MFRPTWRMESFSSVCAKSNGYTASGPTCFFPMMPGAGETDLSRAPLVPYPPLYPSAHSKPPQGQLGPCSHVSKRPGSLGVKCSEQVTLSRVAQDKATPLWSREGSCAKPLTCANTSSAQQQRQALHPVKGVEVVDVLVQAIHSVLMLPAEMP